MGAELAGGEAALVGVCGGEDAGVGTTQESIPAGDKSSGVQTALAGAPEASVPAASAPALDSSVAAALQ
jgi:hypothetical protein